MDSWGGVTIGPNNTSEELIPLHAKPGCMLPQSSLESTVVPLRGGFRGSAPGARAPPLGKTEMNNLLYTITRSAVGLPVCDSRDIGNRTTNIEKPLSLAVRASSCTSTANLYYNFST